MNSSKPTSPTGDSHWLDKIIQEQAAYYGLTVEQHKELMDRLAQFDEDNPQL